MVQPFINNEYPVPAKLRNTYPADLAPVMESNDPHAWQQAIWWLDRFRLWSPRTRDDDADPGHGLVLHGPIGTGKTSTASAWLNAIARDGGYSVAFLGDDEVAHKIRYRWRDSDLDDEFLRLQRLGYVVIDDLMRLGTQNVPLDVEAFLRARVRNGLPTIITVNNAVQLPETLASVLKTWTWAFYKGADLRDPDTER